MRPVGGAKQLERRRERAIALLKDGRAPGWLRMNCSATRSRSAVDAPGRTARATTASVCATMRPAAAIVSTSRGDLIVIIAR